MYVYIYLVLQTPTVFYVGPEITWTSNFLEKTSFYGRTSRNPAQPCFAQAKTCSGALADAPGLEAFLEHSVAAPVQTLLVQAIEANYDKKTSHAYG